MSNGNGSSAVQQAEVETREISSADKKMSKIDLKRLQIYQERRKRLLNKGVSEDRVDSMLAAEDYTNLSVSERLSRFEKMVVGAFQGMQNDIMALQHNDKVIAEVIDVNLKAMARCLERAGLSKEAQADIVREVEKEMLEEQKALAAAREHAAKEAQEKQEKKNIAEKADEAPEDVPVPIPDGATVFGG